MRYLTLRQLKFSYMRLILCNDTAVCLEAVCYRFLWINDRTILECYMENTEKHWKCNACIQVETIFVLNMYLFIFLFMSFSALNQYLKIYFLKRPKRSIFPSIRHCFWKFSWVICVIKINEITVIPFSVQNEG